MLCKTKSGIINDKVLDEVKEMFMKREFEYSHAKFIYTKNELGYQEVLDHFGSAEKIAILTYNISERKTNLLDIIKNLNHDVEISLFTNIPNRWETYFNEKYRELASKKINIYLTKLSAERLGERVSVFFNFQNHGKIIATDKMVYVGSSNFSDESSNNIEFGSIIYDENLSKYLFEELIPEIQNDSIPYYDYNYLPLLLEAEMAMTAFDALKNELHDQIFILHDDIDGEWWSYNTISDELSLNTCSSIIKMARNLYSITSDIYDAINSLTNGSEEKLDVVEEMREELHSIYNEIEDILETSEVYDLASFEINTRINELLQIDYAMEAYEENLENCIEKASDTAMLELLDLANIAEENLKLSHQYLNELLNKYDELLSYFKKFQLVKRNSDIDNT